MQITKIVSGGQTGVDRAALDAAMKAGIPVGGWCPRGRLAEDGVIDPGYPLLETPSSDYSARTELNVRDSDATLILYEREIKGGTLLTLRLAEKLGRPVKAVDLEKKSLREFPFPGLTGILNIAGPRESQCPGIYRKVYGLLLRLFSELL